jgi:hypothetical protein
MESLQYEQTNGRRDTGGESRCEAAEYEGTRTNGSAGHEMDEDGHKWMEGAKMSTKRSTAASGDTDVSGDSTIAAAEMLSWMSNSTVAQMEMNRRVRNEWHRGGRLMDMGGQDARLGA